METPSESVRFWPTDVAQGTEIVRPDFTKGAECSASIAGRAAGATERAKARLNCAAGGIPRAALRVGLAGKAHALACLQPARSA
jgi:hypothetical protein